MTSSTSDHLPFPVLEGHVIAELRDMHAAVMSTAARAG